MPKLSSAHSPAFPSLHLPYNSFSNPYIALPTSLLILHEQSSFSSLSITSPMLQLILQPFPSLYLRHCSFSNPSVASPTSQFILQHFFCFSYVTSSSFNSPDDPPMAMRRHLSTTTLCGLLKYYITTINVLNFINKIIKIVMKGGKTIK